MKLTLTRLQYKLWNMFLTRKREREMGKIGPIEAAPYWCREHKGQRFRADDPNQVKLGLAINYKCLHGVEYVITGECVDALRTGQFSTPCDCPEIDNVNLTTDHTQRG